CQHPVALPPAREAPVHLPPREGNGGERREAARGAVRASPLLVPPRHPLLRSRTALAKRLPRSRRLWTRGCRRRCRCECGCGGRGRIRGRRRGGRARRRGRRKRERCRLSRGVSMSVPFRLSKVRLINWHNFIDETIEVDGSLFLIGDNGSGKTTLLDAIHCALTGDWKVELNAAARVGGRREEGRDLVGIVLRKDFEKGFGRPDGAIAYSALEFRRDLPGARQGACLSVGIGVYVPSAESRPEKWGFVVPRSLEEVSLTRAVERRNGSTRAERPSDRSELASHLGPGHVFDIGRYRSRLGERLYGSRDNLEQVATFLQAGKD